MRAALGVAAVVAVLLLGPCVAIDIAAPTDRIVTGGRIWKCELLGGSRGIDLAETVGLKPGYGLARAGYVIHHGVHLVAADVVEAGTRSEEVVGRGVWVERGDEPGEVGAMDDTARRFSTKESKHTTKWHHFAIRAARECGRRNLPH